MFPSSRCNTSSPSLQSLSPQSPSLCSPSPQSSSPESFALSSTSSPSNQLLPKFLSPPLDLHTSPIVNLQLSGSSHMQPPTCMSISSPNPFQSQSCFSTLTSTQSNTEYFIPSSFRSVLNSPLNTTPTTLSSNQSAFAKVSMQQYPFHFPTSLRVLSSQTPCLSSPPGPPTIKPPIFHSSFKPPLALEYTFSNTSAGV